ncbi:hypothetical protein [Proteocatella sphenisci]|nr:hypothetical protein [Proteocatella sphenisci]
MKSTADKKTSTAVPTFSINLTKIADYDLIQAYVCSGSNREIIKGQN